MYDFRSIIKKNHHTSRDIILHVGTNGTNKYWSREILDKLLHLRLFIGSELPTSRIIISTPTYRNDKCSLANKH